MKEININNKMKFDIHVVFPGGREINIKYHYGKYHYGISRFGEICVREMVFTTLDVAGNY